MKKLVKMVKLNNLQYNANRDPQVYRRLAEEPFRIQALLDGGGDTHCSVIDAEGNVLAKDTVRAPGTFSCEIKFAKPGIRLVTLVVERGGERFNQDLRLDVLDHAWVG